LGYPVREDGEAHNCLKDAEAAMNLVLAKLKHGFNDPIEVATSSYVRDQKRRISVSKNKKKFLNLPLIVMIPSDFFVVIFLGD
jgi:hypothetical protein